MKRKTVKPLGQKQIPKVVSPNCTVPTKRRTNTAGSAPAVTGSGTEIQIILGSALFNFWHPCYFFMIMSRIVHLDLTANINGKVIKFASWTARGKILVKANNQPHAVLDHQIWWCISVSGRLTGPHPDHIQGGTHFPEYALGQSLEGWRIEAVSPRALTGCRRCCCCPWGRLAPPPC